VNPLRSGRAGRVDAYHLAGHLVAASLVGGFARFERQPCDGWRSERFRKFGRPTEIGFPRVCDGRWPNPLVSEIVELHAGPLAVSIMLEQGGEASATHLAEQGRARDVEMIEQRLAWIAWPSESMSRQRFAAWLEASAEDLVRAHWRDVVQVAKFLQSTQKRTLDLWNDVQDFVSRGERQGKQFRKRAPRPRASAGSSP
jgi:hypothetical protein